jgi:hypothetical protein
MNNHCSIEVFSFWIDRDSPIVTGDVVSTSQVVGQTGKVMFVLEFWKIVFSARAAVFQEWNIMTALNNAANNE